MKTLCLLRHAKSSWSSPALADFDRPLNERGSRAATQMGRYMAGEGLVPEMILSSSARRAVETLGSVVAAFGDQVPTQRLKALYLADVNTILGVIRKTSEAVSAILVIGHNPGLHEFALQIVGEGPKHMIEDLAAKFPTGALAVLKIATRRWSELAPGSARIERFIRPRDLVDS